MHYNTLIIRTYEYLHTYFNAYIKLIISFDNFIDHHMFYKRYLYFEVTGPIFVVGDKVHTLVGNIWYVQAFPRVDRPPGTACPQQPLTIYLTRSVSMYRIISI